MFEHTDQMNRVIRLKEKPRRVISIVPSQSEFLWDIGLQAELKGITKFCIHPNNMFTSVERVGGTKRLDLEKIRELQPDLIIGNKEENERAQVEALAGEFNVWMSDIYTFDDALDMMARLGKVFEREEQAQVIIDRLKRSLPSVKDIFKGQRTAYFIWNKPYMFAAKHTFIDHVLNYIGLENALSGAERYPELDDAALQQINPELCFLSSEPFPFKEEHVKVLQAKLPAAKILIVDGEVFSWYGSRLLHLEGYVKGLKGKLLMI